MLYSLSHQQHNNFYLLLSLVSSFHHALSVMMTIHAVLQHILHPRSFSMPQNSYGYCCGPKPMVYFRTLRYRYQHDQCHLEPYHLLLFPIHKITDHLFLHLTEKDFLQSNHYTPVLPGTIPINNPLFSMLLNTHTMCHPFVILRLLNTVKRSSHNHYLENMHIRYYMN